MTKISIIWGSISNNNSLSERQKQLTRELLWQWCICRDGQLYNDAPLWNSFHNPLVKGHSPVMLMTDAQKLVPERNRYKILVSKHIMLYSAPESGTRKIRYQTAWHTLQKLAPFLLVPDCGTIFLSVCRRHKGSCSNRPSNMLPPTTYRDIVMKWQQYYVLSEMSCCALRNDKK